jgi:hypothetical protein
VGETWHPDCLSGTLTVRRDWVSVRGAAGPFFPREVAAHAAADLRDEVHGIRERDAGGVVGRSGEDVL